jgi:hypothetical protein
MYIVPQSASKTIYFAMPTGLSANIIFDVVGYFAISQATALQCTTNQIQGSGSGNVANNTEFSISSAAVCAAGYTALALSCDYGGTSPAGLALTQVGPGVIGTGYTACAWRNQTGGTLDANNFYAVTSCCRLPGR